MRSWIASRGSRSAHQDLRLDVIEPNFVDVDEAGLGRRPEVDGGEDLAERLRLHLLLGGQPVPLLVLDLVEEMLRDADRFEAARAHEVLSQGLVDSARLDIERLVAASRSIKSIEQETVVGTW